MAQPRKPGGIDLDLVRSLATILNETGLTEIEVDSDGLLIRVAKAMAPVPTAMVTAAPVAASSTIGSSTLSAVADGTIETLADHPGVLTSPMVGVVYTAPEPGAPPFVRLGDRVTAGDTVLLIEAMKVFNPIKAHRAGKIERLFVETGRPVEFGEPLLMIV